MFNLVGQERPERSGRPNAVEILMNSSQRILLSSDGFIQTEYAIVCPISFVVLMESVQPHGEPQMCKKALNFIQFNLYSCVIIMYCVSVTGIALCRY